MRVGERLGAPEQGNDVRRPAAPADPGGQHEVLLGLEKDFRRALHRAVDAELFRVAAVELAEEVNDPSPDRRRNQLDLSQAAFLDRPQEPIGLAQLTARRRGGPALPGPEAVLCDFQNGALDHDLRSHDNPGMEERVESQEVYAGKLLRVFKDRVRLPDGRLTTREIVRHPGSVGLSEKPNPGSEGTTT